MTMPDERLRAVLNAEQFLYDLLDSKKTPRVPREVRLRARRVLKHFPSPFYMEIAAEKAPDVFIMEKRDQK